MAGASQRNKTVKNGHSTSFDSDVRHGPAGLLDDRTKVLAREEQVLASLRHNRKMGAPERRTVSLPSVGLGLADGHLGDEREEEAARVTLRLDQAVCEPGGSVVARWMADPEADEVYDHRSWDFLALHPTDKGPGGRAS